LKREQLILLAAGVILLALILAKKKKQPEPLNVIRPGDKGNEVLGLQTALSSMTGVRLGNMGVYDNETLSAVQYYLQGSNSLRDYEKGYVNKDFAADLYLLQSRGKKS